MSRLPSYSASQNRAWRADLAAARKRSDNPGSRSPDLYGGRCPHCHRQVDWKLRWRDTVNGPVLDGRCPHCDHLGREMPVRDERVKELAAAQGLEWRSPR